MEKSEDIKDLAKALALAQGQMKTAAKTGVNKFFSNAKYSTIEDIRDVAIPALSSNGLSIMQLTDLRETGAVLATTLIHSSGQWVSSIYPLLATKQDPQGLKSALTYARRGSLEALLCIASGDEDDDAEAATGRKPEVPKPSPQQQIQTLKKEYAADAKTVEMGLKKATTGTSTGKTFEQILNADRKNNFAWANSIHSIFTSGKRLEPWQEEFLHYAEARGVDL